MEDLNKDIMENFLQKKIMRDRIHREMQERICNPGYTSSISIECKNCLRWFRPLDKVNEQIYMIVSCNDICSDKCQSEQYGKLAKRCAKWFNHGNLFKDDNLE
jgi:hypothetical protein